MPMPYTCRHASAEFRSYLDLAKNLMALDSDNAICTATEGVVLTSRA